MSSKGREIYVYYQVSQALGRNVVAWERWVIVGERPVIGVCAGGPQRQAVKETLSRGAECGQKRVSFNAPKPSIITNFSGYTHREPGGNQEAESGGAGGAGGQ